MKVERETKVWTMREGDGPAAEKAIAEAAGLLRQGGTVAFPTETVYGLGADAANTAAVERVFAATGRPSDNPLIVHIADRSQLEGIVLPYGEIARKLMERFWPGPLTLVLPARPGAVSPRVTAGLDTVAVRMPAHPIALRLIAAAGCPVAAPSANRSGRPSPTRAEHVRGDLAGRIDGLVDGGAADVGLESTVVEIDDGRIRVLRPGGVTPEALRQAAGCEVELDESLRAPLDPQFGEAGAASGAPRSPGMKYAHYAPRGEMVLVAGEPEAVRRYIEAQEAAARLAGCRTGVLTYDERAAGFRADAVLTLGSEARLEAAAHRLYDALREFDRLGVERIWAEACAPCGIGLALMNRLAKAAGNRLVRV